MDNDLIKRIVAELGEPKIDPAVYDGMFRLQAELDARPGLIAAIAKLQAKAETE